ncbi:hypothetical protein StoSoilB13_06120 [Arthrobacter sp. StoSoilB13]|nr:hypothetical protein StoSoilB13_06120 [Arthrobacter sp. StoSoilB13]
MGLAVVTVLLFRFVPDRGLQQITGSSPVRGIYGTMEILSDLGCAGSIYGATCRSKEEKAGGSSGDYSAHGPQLKRLDQATEPSTCTHAFLPATDTKQPEDLLWL